MKKFLTKLYQKSPVFFQNFMVSVYGWLWMKRRFGGAFEEELKGFKDREFWTKDQWVIYQNKKLQELLRHAKETVPFYKEMYQNIDIETIHIDKLNELPILSKHALRINGKSSLISTKKNAKGQFHYSSGSTGTPTAIFMTPVMQQQVQALMEARVRNWAGLTNKSARGMIGGRRVLPDAQSKPPFHRYNFAEKQVYFSAYHISDQTVNDYVQAMYKYKIEYMTGYAMSNFILAKAIENKGLKAPKLKAVITSSEKLTEEMKDTFERVYHCRTYDTYSGVEACGYISECSEGKLHFHPDSGVLELIKENNEYALPGEMGEVILTGFLNFDQPLIRYQIGDLAKLSQDQTCTCGMNTQIIDEIVGRKEDVVVGRDGRKMVRFHGVYLGIPKIAEGQVIQHSLDKIELKLVVDQDLTSQEMETIKNRVLSQLGELEVIITKVDEIPRTEGGKFKAVISHLKKGDE
jgi:phenylacetate-CoA ligase